MYIDYFSYLLVLFITVFSMYLIVSKREFIRENRTIILFVLIGILLYSQYSRYFARLFTINAAYDIKDIPLNYCRISAVMITIYVFTKNKYVAQFIYFQSALGFFSILFPGGDFFILTQDHRAIGYIFDHYMISLMSVFLIYIDRIRPTKKMMYFMMGYAIIIPFSLLPYALNTGHNVFYILDGVFIPMVFGNNQVIISIVYAIGITLYFFLMYKISFILIKHSETPQKRPLFKPLWPWISLGVFTLLGLTIGSLFINTVPTVIDTLTDSYISTPVKTLDEFANVYEGEKNNDTIFFIQLLEKYEEVEVMDYEGNYLSVSNEKDVYYYLQDNAEGSVIIILYKNRGEENEKTKTYHYNN